MEKISIVMATFNSAATLEMSLLSIASQISGNFEFVVVDGGSTDKTLDILEKHKSIVDVLISEPDNGVYDALNKGIRASHGDWILVLGSDDTLYSSTVIAEVEKELEPGISVLYGSLISNFSSNLLIEFPEPAVLAQKYNGAIPLFHQCAFVRKADLLSLGLFDLAYSVHGDFDMFCRLFSAGCYFKKTKILIAKYNATGLSGINAKTFFKNMKEFVSILHNFNSLDFYWILRLCKNFIYLAYSFIKVRR